MREIAGLLVQSGISIVDPIHALLWFVATWAFRSYWIGLIACVAVAIVEEFCWAHTTVAGLGGSTNYAMGIGGAFLWHGIFYLALRFFRSKEDKRETESSAPPAPSHSDSVAK